MLDARKLQCINLKFQGMDITTIAGIVGISRTTYYEWIKTEEFKTEVDRNERELLSSTKQILYGYGVRAAKGLMEIAEHGESEKARLDAYSKLLDKCVSNANKIDIEDARTGKDTVTTDLLTEELNDIDAE